MRRVPALLLALGLCLGLVPAARAEWPSRPLTIIVPFGPGGGGDVAARSIGRWLEPRLGQPVVVVNRPGAGGEIGFAATRRAAPDGYTFGIVTLPNLVTIPIERRAQYAVEDLDPVANLVDDVGGIFVRADSRIRSLQDLLREARGNPGGVGFGTTGVGSYAHFGMLALERLAGVTLTPVAYGGTAAMRGALVQGELLVAGLSMTDAAPELQSGLFRSLGQMAAERWPGRPEIPTLREQGYDIRHSAMRGLAAPAGTPTGVIRQMSELLGEASRDPAYRRLAETQALPLRFRDTKAFAAEIARQQAQYGQLWREQPWRD
ncbi:tripartite tricarboxylate transporter substrate binding protein [Paeniroseomonas aquatica]|uniref:Tripartite tricarboxylate transporter substrate binding protein n=1 Tax=Paeniroseomonas aquatica TaxID=373043 RepID=A0ABT8AE86_9PROT|nr:tripartite tricarboxylate transporter substrate binding protein [Paeniroseomonas aquatica]MDN3568050.1 tripartite tricarboxylate transporter substrate binding protein [Paeniroseomonas aquatica]